jgi:3-hexulose-6-phosphate synthase/6-phospho-3-hexuloisomerase
MKKIINPHPKVNQSLVNEFRKLRDVLSLSCVVADSMERDNVMYSQIKIRTSSEKFIGPALTVKLFPGDLVDCLDALRVAEPGDVIVVDAHGETETSIWGGMMSGLCKVKGVVGAVVDGAIRDTDETRLIGFAVASRAIVPRSTHSPYSQRMEPIEINVPIHCGGVLVRPGDIVIADEIGVVVVPLEDAPQVLEKAKAQAEAEEKTRNRISQGKTVEELLAEFGRL